jgi:GST-like protein
MLKLHTWTTPNGIKPLILLEELGLPYETHWVNIGKGEQHEPAYLKINPNAKIPALEDDGVPIFESPGGFSRGAAGRGRTRSGGSSSRWGASGRCSGSSAIS